MQLWDYITALDLIAILSFVLANNIFNSIKT